MATGTLQRHLGHDDHGRELTYEEFLAGDYEEGYRYELIEGRLYVSPFPNYPHDWMLSHVNELLTIYRVKNPAVVARLSSASRVFIPGKTKTTCPEPDFALYQSCPPGREVKWQDISPMIVVEIASPFNSEKDYVRNVELYQLVPSIREYWVFDKYADDNGPTLRVYHRSAARQSWEISDYGPRDVYTTELLPGFQLPVCPPK
ncbi:Uma2 family endonuclease [Anatilimnocola floriformis]|uniref:Uma2 family endonuclease n=1 Tax=Anatilimnocola floriformis TaxID=2948575 RepID=UPI0020C4360E|nr:Uma2 family endonuclease [Anatilimnocola floriformis]